MDVSHFPFVHPNILARPELPAAGPVPVLHETDWGLHYRVDNQYYRSVDGSFETTVSYEYYQWFPFTMHIRILEDEERVTVVTRGRVAHRVRKRTRVFRVVHRNYENDDPNFVANYLHVLEQDRRVVESIRPEEIPRASKDELHIRVPGPGLDRLPAVARDGRLAGRSRALGRVARSTGSPRNAP